MEIVTAGEIEGKEGQWRGAKNLHLFHGSFLGLCNRFSRVEKRIRGG